MSGPIVRSGATPEYWANWDRVFGKKQGKQESTKKSAGKKPPKAGKAPKKKTARKSKGAGKK